jgi:hypothetical protein
MIESDVLEPDGIHPVGNVRHPQPIEHLQDRPVFF